MRYFLAIDKKLNDYKCKLLQNNYIWKELDKGNLNDIRYEINEINNVKYVKNIFYDSFHYEIVETDFFYLDDNYGWQPCTKIMNEFLKSGKLEDKNFERIMGQEVKVKAMDKRYRFSDSRTIKVAFSEKIYVSKNDIPKTMPNKKIDKIIFCTHGIGRKMNSVNAFENMIQAYNDKLSSELDINVLMVPITWSADILEDYIDNLFTDENVYTDMIKKSSIEVLYYTCCIENRERLYFYIINYINTMMKYFRENFDITKTDYTFIGHSMGSIIMSDILTDEKLIKTLDVNIDTYFSMGSPWPMTRHLIDLNKQTRKFVNIKHFYNIKYDNDPLSYMYSNYFTGKKIYTNLSRQEKIEELHFQDINPINGHVDFIIKEDSFINIFKVNYISAPMSHVKYFDNDKVFRFIKENIVSINKLI